MSYEDRKAPKTKRIFHKKLTAKKGAEIHDVVDVTAGVGGAALAVSGAPIVGTALVAGTAVDVAHRHYSGKRKAAKPWK